MHIRLAVAPALPQPGPFPLTFYLCLATLVVNLPMQEAATWRDHP